MVNWKLLKMKIRKFVRYVLKHYEKEIKRYVNEQIDQKLLEVQKVVSEEVRKRIKNDIIAQAIEQGVDIYSSAGAETVKTMISEQLDKLSQRE